MANINIRNVLAYTLFWVYTFQCFGVLNSYYVHVDIPHASQLFYWGSTVCNIIALTACALLNKRVSTIIDSHGALALSGVFCSAGALVSGLIPLGSQFFSVMFICSVLLTGIGTALFYFQLASAFLCINPQHVILNVLAAYFLSMLLNSVFSLLPGVLSLILVALLPAIASLLLMNSKLNELSYNKSKIPKEGSKRTVINLIIKLCACMIVFTVGAGMLKGLYLAVSPQWNISMSLSLGISTAVILLLFLFSFNLSKKLDAVIVYRIVFFVSIIFICVLSINQSNRDIAFAIQRASGDLFRFLIFIFSIRLCQRTVYPPLAVFGGLLALSKVVSFTIGLFLVLTPTITFDPVSPAVSLALLAIMAFFYLFIFTEEDVHKLMETSHVASIREANTLRCSSLATKWELSQRETEVMELYSEGKTISAIAKELFLSENTVSMYRKKLYTKMDIHSKQELLALLEKEEHLLSR